MNTLKDMSNADLEVLATGIRLVLSYPKYLKESLVDELTREWNEVLDERDVRKIRR